MCVCVFLSENCFKKNSCFASLVSNIKKWGKNCSHVAFAPLCIVTFTVITIINNINNIIIVIMYYFLCLEKKVPKNLPSAPVFRILESYSRPVELGKIWNVLPVGEIS